MEHSDRILDLRASETIDLSAIDADSTTAGDQAFAIVAAFTGSGGQMTIAYDAGEGTSEILMDIDGDGAADMRIIVNGDREAHTGWDL